MNKERQELKDSAMGVAMDHYTSTEVNNLLINCILITCIVKIHLQLCTLIEKIENVCRSSDGAKKYNDEQHFRLALDVLFREV